MSILISRYTDFVRDDDIINGYHAHGECEQFYSEIRTDVSDDARQKMFDNVKREFIQENGISNGDTTKRSKIFREYQLSVKKEDRAKGTWTLQQYEGKYRSAMYAAVKAVNPNWQPGQPFDSSILDSVTRELVESNLVQSQDTQNMPKA